MIYTPVSDPLVDISKPHRTNIFGAAVQIPGTQRERLHAATGSAKAEAGELLVPPKNGHHWAQNHPESFGGFLK